MLGAADAVSLNGSAVTVHRGAERPQQYGAAGRWLGCVGRATLTLTMAAFDNRSTEPQRCHKLHKVLAAAK